MTAVAERHASDFESAADALLQQTCARLGAHADAALLRLCVLVATISLACLPACCPSAVCPVVFHEQPACSF